MDMDSVKSGYALPGDRKFRRKKFRREQFCRKKFHRWQIRRRQFCRKQFRRTTVSPQASFAADSFPADSFAASSFTWTTPLKSIIPTFQMILSKEKKIFFLVQNKFLDLENFQKKKTS